MTDHRFHPIICNLQFSIIILRKRYLGHAAYHTVSDTLSRPRGPVHEIAQRIIDQHFMLARFICHPFYGFNDMRVGTQDQIRTVFRKYLGPFLLRSIRCQPVLRSPVRTYDGEVRQFLCPLNICRHLLFLQQIHRIGHIRRQGNAVGPISVVQDCNPYISQLNDRRICAAESGGIRSIMNTKDSDLWIFVPPVLRTVYQPRTPLVHGMVCGMTDDIESCSHQ